MSKLSDGIFYETEIEHYINPFSGLPEKKEHIFAKVTIVVGGTLSNSLFEEENEEQLGVMRESIKRHLAQRIEEGFLKMALEHITGDIEKEMIYETPLVKKTLIVSHPRDMLPSKREEIFGVLSKQRRKVSE